MISATVRRTARFACVSIIAACLAACNGSTPTRPDSDLMVTNLTVSGDLSVGGTTRTGVLEITGGGDVAEAFVIRGAAPIVPGQVVVIDPDNPGSLSLSYRSYDHRVAGVIAGAGDLTPGIKLDRADFANSGHYVALAGVVYVLADASAAEILPGDLLTTSDNVGHAMKASDRQHAYGAILGKALTPLREGQGLVLTILSPQ